LWRCFVISDIKKDIKNYYETIKLIEIIEDEISSLKSMLENYKKFNLDVDVSSLPFNYIRSNGTLPKSYIEQGVESKYLTLEREIEQKEMEILNLSYKINKISVLINKLSDYDRKLLELIYKNKKSFRDISLLLHESSTNIYKKYNAILEYLNNFF